MKIKSLVDEKLEKIIQPKLNDFHREIEELKTSYNFFNEEFEENKGVLSEQKAEILEVNEALHSLLCEVNSLKNTNQDLVDELNAQNQYGRRNNIEIDGILKHKNENTRQLVIRLFSAMGLKINPMLISTAHRLPITAEQRKNGDNETIIVRFVSRDAKRFVIANRGNLKHIRDPMFKSSNIRIKNNLSPSNKSLLQRAMKLKDDGIVTFVWEKDCNILVRVQKNSKVVKIKSLRDIEKLAKPNTAAKKP